MFLVIKSLSLLTTFLVSQSHSQWTMIQRRYHEEIPVSETDGDGETSGPAEGGN